MNYHSGFHAYRWIRGQEYDPGESAPSQRPVDRFVNTSYPEDWRLRVGQFLANTTRLRPRMIGSRRRSWMKPWLLWIDCFDPHEPWDRLRDLGYPDDSIVLVLGRTSGVSSSVPAVSPTNCII